MGVAGLLPFVKGTLTQCHVADFYGKVIGIDTYIYIYRFWYRVGNVETVIKLFINQIELFSTYNVKPLYVMDGRRPSAKDTTYELRLGESEIVFDDDDDQNEQVFTTFPLEDIVSRLVKVLRQMNIDYICAPYESDQQLTWLDKTLVIDAVLSEDSDYIVHNCRQVIYKMDSNGYGQLWDNSKLGQVMGMKQCNLELSVILRWICIVAGTDYFPSPYGVGFGKVKKLLPFIKSMNMHEFIQLAITTIPEITCQDHELYTELFYQADQTFLFEVVYDFMGKKLVPLTPNDFTASTIEFAGEFYDDKIAQQVALGNVHPVTLHRYSDGHFNPSTIDTAYDDYSIFSPNFHPTARPSFEFVPPPSRPPEYVIVTEWICDVCYMELSSSSNLSQHRRIHTGEKPYQCQGCGRKFRLQEHLRRHYALHDEQGGLDWKCEICQQLFRQKSHLDIHIADIHNNEKRFFCDKCDYSTFFKQSMDKHKDVHNRNPNQCTKCNKFFATSEILNSHFDNCGVPKEFQCPHCDESYDVYLSFHSHMKRNHPNLDKLHKCALCTESFNTVGLLAKHMDFHLNPKEFQCPHCIYSYATKRRLVEHNQRIHL